MDRTTPAQTDAAISSTGVLASMCLALVLVVATVSSVNLALSEISVDLRTTSSQLTWIADGYTVALAALVLPFGALGDRLGRRTLLLLGTVVFGASALAGAAAQTPELLIACRVVMGLGAAMIMPGTLSTITAVFPPEERGRAVSVWAGFASSGAILGLLACGLVLEQSSWRAAFVMTGVLAAIAFVAAAKLAPNTSDPEDTPLDVPGYLLSGAGFGALVYGIIEGAEAGWAAGSARLGLAVAATSLVGFVLWELRTAHPMLDVRLFKLGGFTAGSVAITVQFLCLFGFFLVGMQFVLLMLGYSPLVAGLSLVPMGMVVMPLSRRAVPRLADHLGARRLMTVGLLLLAAGLGITAQLDSESSYWAFLAGLLVVGLGMALTSTPATTSIVSSLPRAKQGVASAVNDVSREIGAALGIAILGSTFNSGYGDAVAGNVAGLPPEAAHAAQESAGAGLAIAEKLGPAGVQLTSDVRDAFGAGLSNAMLAGSLIALAGAALVALFAPRHTASPVEPRRPADEIGPADAGLVKELTA